MPSTSRWYSPNLRAPHAAASKMAALRAGRVDLERRRAVIAESVTVVQGKGLVWGTPKTHQRREDPLPRFLVEQLAPHLARLAPDALVFTGVRRGSPLRAAIFRRGHFDAAASAIGIPGLHPHELRHTAASLAIAAGADVKVVQQMLGHASATHDHGHLRPPVREPSGRGRRCARPCASAVGGRRRPVANRGGRGPGSVSRCVPGGPPKGK
jgi:integrase